MTTRDGNGNRKQGRPAVRERSDKRVTVRFRYHCDRDLIDVLEEVPNASQFIREAMRTHIEQSEARNDRSHAQESTPGGPYA
jgi:metal-responsive CopG/Arc/MetJ family transcriptional regulator